MVGIKGKSGGSRIGAGKKSIYKEPKVKLQILVPERINDQLEVLTKETKLSKSDLISSMIEDHL